MKTDLPDISDLDSERLLALRSQIDARLGDLRTDLIEQAERLGLVVTNGEPKKRRGRKPKDADEEATE